MPKKTNTQKPVQQAPTRKTTMLTWFFLIVWVFLISFGAISIQNPKWLQHLSKSGREGESRENRGYGDQFLARKNFQMAIIHYQEAIRIKPDYSEAIINMAIAYSHLGDYANSVKLLQGELLRENSDKGVIYYTLGEIHERQKQWNDSLRFYRNALDTAVADYLVYRKIGVILLKLEKYLEARDTFEKALENQTDPRASYKNMLEQNLQNFDDFPEEKQRIQEQLDRKITLEQLEIYDLGIIRAMHQTDREISLTHNYLGTINTHLGETGKAIEHFKEALRIWPDNTTAKQNLQSLQ